MQKTKPLIKNENSGISHRITLSSKVIEGKWFFAKEVVGLECHVIQLYDGFLDHMSGNQNFFLIGIAAIFWS